MVGGDSSYLVNLRGPMLRAMVGLGHHVVACAPNATESERMQLTVWGVEYRNIFIRPVGLNPLSDFRTVFSLFRLFRRERPDAVLAYTAKAVIWGGVAARLARVPASYAMITGLGYAFICGQSVKRRCISRVVSVLYRAGLSRTNSVFFQNLDDRKEFLSRKLLPASAKTVKINGSGVDLVQYSPMPLPDAPIFLLIARLLRDKGVLEYCEAARRVRAKYPQARFLLAGGFDQNPAAISKGELQVWQEQGSIEYLGKLADVREALAQCRVYVLPSYREGTPRTVLEAMSTGRAIITTDAPGCRETVQEAINGFMVPVRDVDALVRAMERFIQDPDLAVRLGKESRRLAEERFDIHGVNQVILETMGLSRDLD